MPVRVVWSESKKRLRDSSPAIPPAINDKVLSFIRKDCGLLGPCILIASTCIFTLPCDTNIHIIIDGLLKNFRLFLGGRNEWIK
jgi:hypothetical protein